MSNRPLIYMWIAYYDDDTFLPQYDKSTFKPNKWNNINMDKLDRLELHPFSKEMETGLCKNGTEVRHIPILPVYSISMEGNRRPICYRDNYISQEEFHLCDACNKEFKFYTTMPQTESKYSSPICPHCGSYDYFFCKICNVKALFEETSNGLCPKCNGYMDRVRVTTRKYARERRWTEYLIGYQLTDKGNNYKFLLRIDEYGNCKVE